MGSVKNVCTETIIDPNLNSRYNLYVELCWPQLGLPLHPVLIFDKTMSPVLDSHYNLYLEFDETMFFADPILDSRYNVYLLFHKNMYTDHS